MFLLLLLIIFASYLSKNKKYLKRNEWEYFKGGEKKSQIVLDGIKSIVLGYLVIVLAHGCR